MVSMRGIRSIGCVLAVSASAGCDLTPTEIDALDAGQLEQLVAKSTPPGPGRALWQHYIDRLDVPAVRAPALPGLDSLFRLSTPADDAANGEPDARHAHRQLLADAWRTIERGDVDSGEQALTAARAYQAETVVRSLGSGTPLVMLSLVGRTLARLDAASRMEPALPPRFHAMSRTARELLQEARQALARGEAALALDLATHAGGLVNAMKGLLPDR